MTPVQLGLLARVDLTRAQMENLVRSMRRGGVCVWDGERLTLTAERAARSPYTPLDAGGYRRFWKRRLGVMAGRLLDTLIEAGGGGLTWAEWQSAAAYAAGGNVSAARRQLMLAGLIEQQGSRYTVSVAWPSEDGPGARQPLLKIAT